MHIYQIIRLAFLVHLSDGFAFPSGSTRKLSLLRSTVEDELTGYDAGQITVLSGLDPVRKRPVSETLSFSFWVCFQNESETLLHYALLTLSFTIISGNVYRGNWT